MTKEQKIKIAEAAPRAMANLTDSTFWREVEQHLEDKSQERAAQVEPRKLRKTINL